MHKFAIYAFGVSLQCLCRDVLSSLKRVKMEIDLNAVPKFVLKKLQVLAGATLSLPSFDIFPGHWSTLANELEFGSPWGNYFTPDMCAASIRRLVISNLNRNRPLRVPILTLVEWSLRDSWLVPREIHVMSGYDLSALIITCRLSDWNKIACDHI